MSELSQISAPLRTTLAAALLVSIGVFYFYCSYGTGNLLQHNFLNIAYDSLAANLLAGSAEVDPGAIGHEKFVLHGKVLTYFGPFPALLRIPFNALVAGHYGSFSGISNFLAAVLSLLAFTGLCLLATAKHRAQNSPLSAVSLPAFILGFALGSPLLFLTSAGYIYHEAIQWGLAASLSALFFLWRMLLREPEFDRSSAIAFSVLTGIALLSRVSFAVPYYCFIAIYLTHKLLLSIRSRCSFRNFLLYALCLAGPAGICFLAQLWYNFARWGDAFTFVNWEAYHNFIKNPPELEHIRAIGFLDWQRLRSAIPAYFGLSSEYFSAAFPWVRMILAEYAEPERYITYREHILSYSVGSPWLVFGSIAGLWSLFRQSTAPYLKLLLLCLLCQAGIILGFFFLSERYSADLLPLLVFLFIVFVRDAKLYTLKAAKVLMLLLVFWSIGATVLAVAHWSANHNLWSPPPFRERMQDLLGVESAVR